MQDNNLQNLWASVFRDNLRLSFNKLTEADVASVGGDADVLPQLLRERYGYSPKEVEEAMDTFMKRYNSFDNSHAGEVAATQPPAPAPEPQVALVVQQ